jgi:long-chain acyl-CoA synthetase
VIDLDTGKTVGPGETGEVVLRGPQVMLGYLKNQSATDDMVKDGWLHTGTFISLFFPTMV